MKQDMKKLQDRSTAEGADQQKTAMIEVISQWPSSGTTRLTILTAGGEGKVQVDLLNNEEDGHTAYIWDLWVNPDHRRRGIARQLMDYAIRRARDYQFPTATLWWSSRDTPLEIAYWYGRLGFEEREFGSGYSRMVKQLDTASVIPAPECPPVTTIGQSRTSRRPPTS